MHNFLETIKQHVQLRFKDKPLPAKLLAVEHADFLTIFNAPTRPTILAEVKLASPSRGVIYKGNLTPVEIAKHYYQNGASALSILTEPHFFKGSIDYLVNIHKAIPDCPLLLKDFVLSEVQIAEAYQSGASAVLLIAGFLEFPLLQALYDYTCSLGLTPLIEVHSHEELEEVLTLHPQLIGINNRNLKTLAIDMQTCCTLIQSVPKGVYVIAESGIHSRNEVNQLTDLGFHGFLIGSSLMQHSNPGEALRALLAEENTHAR